KNKQKQAQENTTNKSSSDKKNESNNIVQTGYTHQRSKVFGFSSESSVFSFLPGNDGEGGDKFKRLREKRAKERSKSLEYQRQFPKDPLGEKIKSLFE
ncbi:10268_t:CDS:1, partial [Dentiscutata erythropus]